MLLTGIMMVPAIARAQPDLKAGAAAIMAADRAFNQSVAARDRVKFLSFIAENATFVGTSDMRGHDAILKGWEAFFQKDGPTLTWEPTGPRNPVLLKAERLFRERIETFNRERFPDGRRRPYPQDVTSG